LRDQKPGFISFTDETGEEWRAFVNELDNTWGVIVQLKESEFLSETLALRRVAWSITAIGTLLVAALIWFSVRQIAHPIGALTETASAIADGDIQRRASVESSDEIGLLARAFNSMTQQLSSLIQDLEQRVTERTRDLERRTAYLEASSEVARAAASVLDSDQLMHVVVEAIREQFDLYYVGLFAKDATGQFALLRAGTGQAGKSMLARGHRIKVGEGMIGWSIANAQPRVAQLASADAVRLATPELPHTRSEAAIPLRSRGRVLGALTIQDSQPGSFDELAIAVWQTMADQVALALDNAKLFAESQNALETIERAYSEMSGGAWQELLSHQRERIFRSSGETGARLQASPSEGGPTLETSTGTSDDAGAYPLNLPIRVRGHTIGSLKTYKSKSAGDWSREEMELLAQLVEQLGLALEDARLFQDAQQRAARERIVGEATARMRSTLDPQSVLQASVDEIYRALGLEAVTIYLSSNDGSDGSRGRGEDR
jgi:nitrate/nitrite-specific signal transduction histidine kinase